MQDNGGHKSMLVVSSFQGHGRVDGTLLFHQGLPSGPAPWAVSSSEKLANTGRVFHGCCPGEERKRKPCVHEDDITCLHMERTNPMRLGSTGTMGQPLTDFLLGLHDFLPTVPCRPHCGFPSEEGGLNHSRCRRNRCCLWRPVH